MDDEQKIVDLWQGQPLAESELNMEAVMKQAQTFQRKIKFRNALEYVGAGVVVLWFGVSAVTNQGPLLVKIGGVLMALGALVVATILRLRGHAALEAPLVAPTREVMRWHRAELARQRDLLRGVPLWYLGPFIPGAALAFVGRGLDNPDRWLPIGLSAALFALVFVGVALLNLRGANKLDEQIEALDRELDA